MTDLAKRVDYEMSSASELRKMLCPTCAAIHAQKTQTSNSESGTAGVDVKGAQRQSMKRPAEDSAEEPSPKRAKSRRGNNAQAAIAGSDRETANASGRKGKGKGRPDRKSSGKMETNNEEGEPRDLPQRQCISLPCTYAVVCHDCC